MSEHVPADFKPSALGPIPGAWDVVELKKIANIIDGDRGKEYPKESDFMKRGACLFLSAKNITSAGFSLAEEVFISHEKDKKLRSGKLVRNDIIITTRGSVGNVALYANSIPYDSIRINSGMAIVRIKNENVFMHEYAYQLMRSQVIQNQVELLNFGSAQPQLTIGIINTLDMPLPPLPEQRKIAAVLSSADRSIAATEKLIAKLADLKKALMQQLLTKGIGHTEFKPSPLGPIPKSWEVKRIKEICSVVQDGTHFSPQSKSGPYKYITSKNIREGFIDLKDCQYISAEEHYEIYRKCRVLPGDVLLTKDGANVGNACINILKEEFSLLSSVAVLRGIPDRLLNEYILHFLLSPVGEQLIKDSISGLAITRMTLTVINNLKICLPPLLEQRKIADILNGVDRKLSAAKVKLAKAKDLKQGLMNDLLTGKVRVSA